MTSVDAKQEPIEFGRPEPMEYTFSCNAEYDGETKQDFEQHLGVIDLPNDQMIQTTSDTPGLIEFEKQLMMLEYQNKVRLARARKQLMVEMIRATSAAESEN